jgi:hypothetical protein
VPKIILQVGHEAPREPGHEGATGAAGEVEFNRIVAQAIEKRIVCDKRFSVRIIPGRIPDDIRNNPRAGDVFISLHCDGSNDPRRGGWGIGFPDHEVNRRLARHLKVEFDKFHRSGFIGWNYTPNMSGYYAWNDLDIPGPEILVEHGFVSNPVERAWLHRTRHRFAEAYYQAICLALNMAPEPIEPPKPPTPLPLHDGPWNIKVKQGLRWKVIGFGFFRHGSKVNLPFVDQIRDAARKHGRVLIEERPSS